MAFRFNYNRPPNAVQPEKKRYISFKISTNSKPLKNAYLPHSSTNFQSLCLLNTQYQFDIFKYMPRTFKISTNNGYELFNIDMLKDSSSIIDNFLKLNPDKLQFNLDIKDEDNILGKFAQLYKNEPASFEEDQLPVSFKITRLLNIINCPNFMKPENLRSKDSTMSFEQYKYKSQTKENEVSISQIPFHNFLRSLPQNTFTIVTNKKQYECSKYGVYSSDIIRNIIINDPTVDKYVYNFDDEFNEFQDICDIFNFKTVKVTKNNMDSLKEIFNDLQITYFTESISKIIENYEQFSQTVDDQQIIIDSIEEVFSWLYNIKELSVNTVRNSIMQSKWVKSEENVQELAAFIIQVIKSGFILQKYIMDLLIDLDKEANETNYLKVLIPIIAEKLMLSFGTTKTICSFVYMLHKKGIISKEKLIDQILHVLQNNIKENPKKEFSFSLNSTSQNMNEIIQNNVYTWFLPELIQLPEYKYKINNGNNNLNGNHEFFIKSFLPDKIHIFEQMRDSGEPSDPITKAIRSDDVDEFQSIITKSRIDAEKCIIPFNMFEEFIRNGSTNYLNYAAAYGSLRCFKYMLLNHFEMDKTTFTHAVHGGNIEIIKIVDQNKNDIKDKSNNNNKFKGYNFNSRKDEMTSKSSKILPAIIKHKNDIFDWIVDQYFADSADDNFIDYNTLITTSALNGNAHSLIEIIDKGYDLESNFNLIVDSVSENGFFNLAKLLVMFIKSKLYKSKNEDVFQKKPKTSFTYGFNQSSSEPIIPSISFGNLSILKLYITNYKITEFQGYFNYAIKNNFISIINYFFNSNTLLFTPALISQAFSTFAKYGDDKNFPYLFEKFNKIPCFNDYVPTLDILFTSCGLGKVLTSKTISNMIYNKKPATDFTESFLNAISFGSFEICKFFIDKKFYINFDIITLNTILSHIKKDILELIINEFSPESKERLLGCYLNLAIQNNNKDLVEYILNENVINEFALIDAVKYRNLEIINLVLEHNSSPSFINKKTKDGPALSIAICPLIKVYYDNENTINIVKRLLSIPGIDPSIYNSENFTPLMLSVKTFNLEVTNAILDFYGENLQSQAWQLNKVIKLILKMLSSNKSKNNSIKSNNFDNQNLITNKKKNEEILPILKRILEIKNIDLNCHGGKYTLLSYACEANEIDIVKMLLNSDKIDANSYAPETGNTPLIIAIMNDNFEIAKLLIEYPQTNINISNFENQTALTIAVDKQLTEIIDLIINNNKFDPIESHLDYAFFKSNNQIARQLLSLKSLDVNYKNIRTYQSRRRVMSAQSESLTDYETKIVKVAATDDVELLNLIVHHPSFDINKSQIKKAIFNSIDEYNIEMFKKLINSINDVNIFKTNGTSLLDYAIIRNNDEAITEILNNPSYDSKKSDILHSFIICFPNNNLIKILYNYDKEHDKLIDLTQLLPDGKSFFTSLKYFKYYDDDINRGRQGYNLRPNNDNNNQNNFNIDDYVKFLCDNGCDPNMPDKNNFFPLQYAITKTDLYALAIALIESGKINFDIKIKAKYHFFKKYALTTYLHIAAEIDNTQIMDAIITNKLIDINATDEFGNTPLIIACMSNNRECILYLFEKDDLDFLHKNNEGKDALMTVHPQCQKQITDKKEYFEQLLLPKLGSVKYHF